MDSPVVFDKRLIDHDCDTPTIWHYMTEGLSGKIATWECECGARWRLGYGRGWHWNRIRGPRRRWRKAEAERRTELIALTEQED